MGDEGVRQFVAARDGPQASADMGAIRGEGLAGEVGDEVGLALELGFGACPGPPGRRGVAGRWRRWPPAAGLFGAVVVAMGVGIGGGVDQGVLEYLAHEGLEVRKAWRRSMASTMAKACSRMPPSISR